MLISILKKIQICEHFSASTRTLIDSLSATTRMDQFMTEIISDPLSFLIEFTTLNKDNESKHRYDKKTKTFLTIIYNTKR